MMGAAGMSAASTGLTADIHTSAPAPAMTLSFMVMPVPPSEVEIMRATRWDA